MKANSMKSIGRRLTFLFLMLCVAVSISAQSYQLSGCVQDENNQPVEVANILLKQAKDSTYLTGMLTDAQGCFTFTGQTRRVGKGRHIETGYRFCPEG